MTVREGGDRLEFSGAYALALFHALGGELGVGVGTQDYASVGLSYRIGRDDGLRLDLFTSVLVAEPSWGGMDVSLRAPLGRDTSLVLRGGGGSAYLIGEVGDCGCPPEAACTCSPRSASSGRAMPCPAAPVTCARRSADAASSGRISAWGWSGPRVGGSAGSPP